MKRYLSCAAATWAFVCTSVAGCGTGMDDEPQLGTTEHVLEAAQVLVPFESDLLAGPVALATSAAGTVYVLDRMERTVIALSPDGEVLSRIGRPGPGPGEFERPVAIRVERDRLYVLDMEHRSVQEFSLDGAHLDSRRLDFAGTPVSYQVGPGGSVAYASFPADEALVRFIDRSGQEVSRLGDLVSGEPMDPETLLEQVHRRETPGFMRNRALPLIGDEGSLWVFLQSEGVLHRYAPDGSLVAERPIRIPEMDLIRDEFFEWYADFTTLGGIRFLDLVDSGAVVNGSIWLLWKVPLDHPVVVTCHDLDGATRARLVVSGVEAQVDVPDPTQPPPRRRFAVDPVRERLYLVDDQSVTLRWAPLPAGLFDERDGR